MALATAALVGGSAQAQVYRWVDESGTVHYQEEPPPTGRRVKRLRLPEGEQGSTESPDAKPGDQRETPAPQAVQVRPPPASERPAVKPKTAPSVELYTTSWCPWCKKAREYFRSRGIAFREHDIDAEPGALERKVGIDGDKRVPMAIIGGRIVRGYAPARYQAALEQP